MIRKCFERYFERVDVKFHNIVAHKMSKALVEVDRKFFVVAGHIPHKTALLTLSKIM